MPDFEPGCIDRLAIVAPRIAQCDRSADRVAVGGRGEVADRFAVAQQRLATPEQRLAILERHRQQAARQGLGFGVDQGLAPEEAARLVELHRPAQPGLPRRIVGRELAAPGAIGLLDAQALDRVVAHVAQAELGAGGVQGLEHRDGELDRHVELPAPFPHVGAARGVDRRVTHTDLAHCGEGERLVGKIRATHLLQQLAAVRPHHRQHRPRPGDVGQGGMDALRQVAADPVGIARNLGGAGDDQEFVGRQPSDREVAFVGATFVQEPGIDRAAHRYGDVVGAKTLERRLAVLALHQELSERSLVGNGHCLASRLMLGGDRVEPGAAAPPILHVRRLADAGEPVGPLPAHLVAEPGAASLEPVVERRTAERPAAFMLALRPRHLVVQAERLGDAVAQPGIVAVEVGEATDIDQQFGCVCVCVCVCAASKCIVMASSAYC